MFEFEALVGHLYIVSGRTLNATPPGLLVEVAPKKAARGREMDTIFVLVTPSGERTAPAAFYEGMARKAAEVYFDSSGSITSGVRAIYTSLNQNLLKHNEEGGPHYEANMLCAILHGNDLFVSRVGSGVALLGFEQAVEMFPSDFDNDEALFGPPLGVQPVPNIRMTRYRVASGTRMIIADVSLAELDPARMEAALHMVDIGAVLVGFRELITRHITLLAVEFVPPELVEAAADPAAAPAPPRPDPARPDRISGAILKGADGLDAVNKVVERTAQQRAAVPAETDAEAEAAPPPRRGFSLGGSVLLIPVALVMGVWLLWLGGTGASEFELCADEVNRAAAVARNIASSDVNGTLSAWNATLLAIEDCEVLRPGEEEMAAVRREGQSIIDRLYDIERRQMTPIEAFPNASLTRVVLRGEDLYVLDDNNDQVYRVTLNQPGTGILPNSRQPITRMRRNASVGQFTVGDLIDITWAESGAGLTQGNVLIALDRSGLVIEYSPTFLTQGVQRLLGVENWVNPIRFQAWEGRLYILDPGANQIWRYDPSGGSYPGAPLEYFTGTARPNLANAVDFAIDNNGRVYILFREGVITLFRGGQQQDFRFAGFPANQTLRDVDAMFFNLNPISPGIYLVSQATRTVFETSQAGTFFNSFRPFDESLFEQLHNVIVDDSRGMIYALSGNAILGFSKSQ